MVAVALAGVIQIVLGIIRGGFIKSFVPSSVVRGLLSAIGVILILKQIPHLFGHDTDPEGEMSFFQPDKQNTFSELLEILGDLHPGAIVVGFVSLAIIYFWGRVPLLKKTGVPAPLVVVLFGVLCSLGLINLVARGLSRRVTKYRFLCQKQFVVFLDYCRIRILVRLRIR